MDDDSGPGPGGRPPAANAAQPRLAEAQGPIRMSLHGPRGEINGVLLTDGTVLRLPPDAAVNLATLLQPGRTVIAQGDEVSNPIGKVPRRCVSSAPRAINSSQWRIPRRPHRRAEDPCETGRHPLQPLCAELDDERRASPPPETLHALDRP